MTCPHDRITTWRLDTGEAVLWACADCKQRFQPLKEWRGLSTAESKTLWNLTKKPSEFAALIDAKLKEKNG